MTASVKRAGGVDRYFYNLLRASSENGFAHEGLVAGHPGAVSDVDGVRTFAAERDALPTKWLKMRRIARPLIAASDVVVSHFAPYAFPILDQIGRRPFVVHFHGPWALESKAEGAGSTAVKIKHEIERTVYRRAARVIVLSQAFADIATREYGVPEDRIRIIPGGVDIERFDANLSKAEARAQLGWPADRPTVVTVRRLVQAKGIENLIKAAIVLRDRVPGIFVAIVGTGPLAETLRQSIVDLGLEDTVRMVGQVAEDQLPSVYRAADFFVVPSIALEGFGLVVVEALASGTPTFVTPIGGLPAAVRALEPSLVLDGCEPEHIADRVAAAFAMNPRVPTEEACKLYARRFAWHGIATQIGDVYREVAPDFATGTAASRDRRLLPLQAPA